MKSVLITGGTRGIGRAMVKLFSEKGYKVAFTYKSSDEAASALSAETGALAIKADSAVREEVEYAASVANRELSGIDCLINNVGISSFSLFTELEYDTWRECMAVNLDSVFLYSKAVIPCMISRGGGTIINISSMWGLVGSSCEVHYSTAKAAVIGMTKALAKELGPSGIRVNAIAPGLIDTDMNSSLSGEDVAELVDDTPLMRIGTPADVAKIAYFLASEDSGFVTGAVINASGGYVV